MRNHNDTRHIIGLIYIAQVSEKVGLGHSENMRRLFQAGNAHV